jgi:hypothetical protein
MSYLDLIAGKAETLFWADKFYYKSSGRKCSDK